MFKNMKIGTKILIAFTTVAILAVGLVGFFAFTTGSNTLEEESFNKLTAVREMKASQVEDYFQLIENQVITFSQDRMIIQAMREFDDGLHAVEGDLVITEEEMKAVDARLEDYYEEEFLPRLIPNLQEEVIVEDFWPEDTKTRVLQDLYISSNPFEVGSKHLLENAADGSSYSQAHQIYHPIIRDYLEKFGYYDIFLVDIDTGGHIAYSVFKEVDFGTSLVTGPYADTNFAEAYEAARASGDKDFVKVVDFEPYAPSYNAPAAFIASPIFDGEEKVGVLVFQFPIDRINAIMTSNQDWSAVGLGKSGETYIVGNDFLLRNQSRFLIEDSENYFRLIEEIGTPLTTIARIRNLNSTIGLQEVKTDGTKAALSGLMGTDIFPDYRGVLVLSSYKPLNIRDTNWAIMSEIDQEEAFSAIRSLAIRTSLAVAGLIVGIVVLATVFSRTITKPIKEVRDQALEIVQGKLDTEIAVDSKDEIGELAHVLNIMRMSNKTLIDELEDINQNLENLVEERTKELELSELRSRSIIESAGEGIIVIDRDSNIILWNQSAEKLFGYAADEIIGHSISRLIPERYVSQHEDAFMRAINSGKLARPGVTHELAGKRKNGNEFPLELTLAVWTVAGETFISGIIRDISERKEAEERIRSIVELAPDAVITIDGQQTVTLFNPTAEQIFGYSAEEVVGQSLTMLMSERSRGIHGLEVEKFSKETSVGRSMDARREIVGQRKDGTIFPAEAGISKMEINGEQYFTTFFRDITERKAAEAQLHLQSSALKAAANGIVITNPEGTIEWVNPAFSDLTGYAFDEAVGQNPRVLNSGQHDETFYQDMWDTITSGQAWFGEVVNKRKDGSLYTEEMTITPILDPSGEIRQYVAIKQDITARKEAEAQLRTLSAALSSAADSIAITDPEDKVEWVNPSFSTLTGYSFDEIVGESITILTSGEHPDEFYSEITEIIRAGKVWQGEMIKKTKDGQLYPEHLSITPIMDDKGEIVNYVSISQDITERKRTEAQLRFLSEALKSTVNGVAIIDLKDKIQWVNPSFEEMTGYSFDEVKGAPISILNSGKHPDEYYEQIGQATYAGEVWRGEIIQKRKDGSFYTEELSVTPIFDEDQEIENFVTIRQDITERKELERQLEIANERMSTELNFARDIQLDMLPLIFPAFPNRTEVTVFAALESAREVGGDFYDFYFLDDDHLCFVIGDVAGKGAPGALMMAVSKTLIKSRAADDSEPASILTHVNDELSQDNKSSMFVTVFLGIINVKSGEFVYTNAGHNPPYIRRRDGSLQKVDAFHGPVVGAMPGLPYQQDRDVLHPGDVILVYTDGVTEAFNEEEKLFSEDRLEARLSSKSFDSAESIVSGTIDEVNRFTGEAEQSDDITLLAVQYLGLPETMKTQELDISIKNRYEDMSLVEDKFAAFAEENDLPDAVKQSMSIVLDEMLNNVISYAYRGEKEKEIEVVFELSGKRLVVTIKDSGVPFNPFARETPDISESIEEREIGGLGIHMVRSLMDEYSYHRQINKNVVTLVKIIEG
jgi:PAS domain S-box-containing protein